jgi:release factor glutamine methyltransferase
VTKDASHIALKGLDAAVVKAAEAVAALAASFRDVGVDDARIDARLLASHVLQTDLAGLLSAPDRILTPAEKARLVCLAQRRLAREPVSRILGRRGFYSLELAVSPATLDPRPDTETVVEVALAWVRQRQRPGWEPRILDLGTGSGAILLALLANLPGAAGMGTDISPQALSVAASNAARIGIADRATFQQADWLEGVAGPFDVVVSNPPYIRRGDIDALEPEVTQYDPRIALDGGDDGLDAYRSILAELPGVIANDALIAFEIGHDQASGVSGLLRHRFAGSRPNQITVWNDLAGRPRCVSLTTIVASA